MQELRSSCKYCGREFRSQNSLIKHEVRHSGLKTFNCKICTKDFYFEKDVQNHMITHSNEKPFGCEICRLKFKRKGELRIHSFIHEGIFRHKCLKCPKAFKQKSELIAHVQNIHSTERPFSCCVCQKTFKQKCNMKTHIKKLHPETSNNIVHTGNSQITPDTNNELFSNVQKKKLNFEEIAFESFKVIEDDPDLFFDMI